MMPLFSLLADLVSAILLLTGAGTMEDLSESEIERFESYASRPLHLNLAPRSKLISSGLMSSYQIASLEDYRSRFGDILSFTELAAVDGFGPEYAQALSLFVSLEASSLKGGRKSYLPLHGTAMLRSAERSSATPKAKTTDAFSGMKYHLEAGERAELFLSTRSTYAIRKYSNPTLSLAFYGRRGVKIVAGDFNARFGQGLIMWSGFSMSGFSSVSAFRKNASGISPTGSFSPSMRGLAGTFPLGRWTLSMACDLPGSRGGVGRVAMPAFSLGRLWRNASLGVQGWTVLSGNDSGQPTSAVSLDWKAGLGAFNVFGECAYSSGLAALAGVVYSPVWKTRLTLLARHYGADYFGAFAGAVRSASKICDEDGLSAGAQWRWASATADYARHPVKGTGQLKLLMDLSPEIALTMPPADWQRLVLLPAVRCIYRNSAAGRRIECRSDLGITWHGANVKYRYHAVSSKGFAWLQYLEAGYKRPETSPGSRLDYSASLRATIFCVDDWQDRIYCYERELPGSFSVPAYYGRGYAISAITSCKLRASQLNCRISILSYERRTTFLNRTELKFQYQLNF